MVYSYLDIPTSVRAPLSDPFSFLLQIHSHHSKLSIHPLFLVCRQIHAEFKTEFYKITELYIIVSTAPPIPEESRRLFKADLSGEATVSKFRNVQLVFSVFWGSNDDFPIWPEAEEYLRKIVDHFLPRPRRFRITIAPKNRYSAWPVDFAYRDALCASLAFLLRPLRGLQGLMSCSMNFSDQWCKVATGHWPTDVHDLLTPILKDIESQSHGPGANSDTNLAVILWREYRKVHMPMFYALTPDDIKQWYWSFGTQRKEHALLKLGLTGDMEGVFEALASILNNMNAINNGKWYDGPRKRKRITILEEKIALYRLEIKAREAALKLGIAWPRLTIDFFI
ncbi:MAG: hypothetical protein M1820_004287 [Bogoriella megaspora]|nr:MAG: hypothetical protein M1820_004287 [Bogoriella megaspora]